jgi:hypothetical protein
MHFHLQSDANRATPEPAAISSSDPPSDSSQEVAADRPAQLELVARHQHIGELRRDPPAVETLDYRAKRQRQISGGQRCRQST